MKLTLNVDKSLLEFARRLARDSNDSVSNMVGTFLRNMRANAQEYCPQNPQVRRLYGCVRKNHLLDKEDMRREILKKHMG
jgi:hypothetical protein